jgi:hypothetical protein
MRAWSRLAPEGENRVERKALVCVRAEELNRAFASAFGRSRVWLGSERPCKQAWASGQRHGTNDGPDDCLVPGVVGEASDETGTRAG